LKNKVSLQINLAPGDYLHARYLLVHQLETLAGQVDEVILTIDTRPAKGRFSEGWETYRETLDRFLSEEITSKFNVRLIPVDYSPVTRGAVAQYFFGENDMPAKDFRGGPFYAYFFGLYTAVNSHVLHLDSDMILGGVSQGWINEALDLFEKNPALLIASPLPGPPHPQDILVGQPAAEKIAPYTYLFNGMSTRIFLIDKSKFEKNKLILRKPGLRNQVKSFIEGNPNADLPEHIFSEFMVKHNFERIDFLGTGKGLWSLHPPYRTTAFYNDLPELLRRIASGDLPEAQYGFYDMVNELCDWQEATAKIKNNRWWKRLLNAR
jgi:hypothetical protein